MGHSITISDYKFPDGIYSLDITYNLSDMYTLAIKNIGYDINKFGEYLDGKKLKELKPFLIKLRNELELHPEIYKKLNPKNNWGVL